MRCVMGWGWLPLTVVLLMTLCMFVTYAIAVLHGDVAALFPYISDTGAELPESAIFAQFLNMAACVASATLFIRYKIIHDLTGSNDVSINRVAAVAVVFGILASFGLSLVGNFQDNKLPIVHFTGAALTFGLGNIYCFLDTACTYKMAPRYNGYYIAHVRLAISAVGTVGLLATGIAGGIASAQYDGAGDTQHWKPTDAGYSAHLVSTFGEWVIAAAFINYFLSHLWDFRKVEATFHVRVTVEHLSLPSPLTDSATVSTPVPGSEEQSHEAAQAPSADTQGSEPNERTTLLKV